MNQMNNGVQVNAVYIVKNEWPLLALTISHALTHYAEKVIIVDTGSEDGIFEGIKVLQTFWSNRIELYRCNQEIYDQIPLTNLLIEMSKENNADWTMILDADEFFVHENYPEFLQKLSQTDEKWSSYAIKVVNFIVNEQHEDSNLDDFSDISYRVVGQNSSSINDTDYPLRVLSGEIPLQSRITPDKLLVRNSSEVFLSQGNHQIVFGDGIWWEKHDSSVSSGSFLGGMICHLPYTSEQRLMARRKRSFFDKQETTYRLNVDSFKRESPASLLSGAVLSAENREKWLQSGVILANESFAQSIAPVIAKLEKIWPQLSVAKFSEDTESSFPDSLDLKIVSKLIRKYHTHTERLWNGGTLGE
jgi:hypothetical protein